MSYHVALWIIIGFASVGMLFLSPWGQRKWLEYKVRRGIDAIAGLAWLLARHNARQQRRRVRHGWR